MRIKSLALPGVAAIVVAALALALGHHRGSATSPKAAASLTTRASHITVPISNYAFVPPALSVRVGTRVTWINRDATAHTATDNGRTFDTGTLNSGQSKTIDLKRPGTYTYHCELHAFMTATIKVVQ
ncbi:MAG: cupredoxin domain-containing protein [Actinomycetota bacterium]|nr:cupredoxin domain-containing protein [Actinomycetota bacterium]